MDESDPKRRRITGGMCRCGAHDHLRITHRSCPLNVRNASHQPVSQFFPQPNVNGQPMMFQMMQGQPYPFFPAHQAPMLIPGTPQQSQFQVVPPPGQMGFFVNTQQDQYPGMMMPQDFFSNSGMSQTQPLYMSTPIQDQSQSTFYMPQQSTGTMLQPQPALAQDKPTQPLSRSDEEDKNDKSRTPVVSSGTDQSTNKNESKSPAVLTLEGIVNLIAAGRRNSIKKDIENGTKLDKEKTTLSDSSKGSSKLNSDSEGSSASSAQGLIKRKLVKDDSNSFGPASTAASIIKSRKRFDSDEYEYVTKEIDTKKKIKKILEAKLAALSEPKDKEEITARHEDLVQLLKDLSILKRRKSLLQKKKKHTADKKIDNPNESVSGNGSSSSGSGSQREQSPDRNVLQSGEKALDLSGSGSGLGSRSGSGLGSRSGSGLMTSSKDSSSPDHNSITESS